MTNYTAVLVSFLLVFLSATTFSQAPTNDEPPNAVILGISSSCTWTAGTTVNATSTYMLPWGYTGPTCPDASCSGGVTAFPKDVFFKFNSTSNTSAIININAPNVIGTVGLIRVYESPNGWDDFSLHSCSCAINSSTSIGSHAISGLTPYTVYFIAVSPKVGTTGFWTPFDICLTQSVVPVTLRSFSVLNNDHKINIKWESEDEINFEKYELQKSYDGKTFDLLHSVEGNRSTNGVSQYNFEYNEQRRGTIYYRLKMIDRDGQFKFSDLRSIQNKSEGTIIYPNPASDILYVSQESSSEDIHYFLFDIYGKKVQEGILTDQIDLQNLAAGSYSLHLPETHEAFKIIVVK